MKSLFNPVVILFLVFMASCSTLKTTPEAIGEITKKVESKNFTVVINYANPMRMKQRYLTSEYDLQIKNDSAFAYLPYFGVAYSAPYGMGEGGIKFADFMKDYSMEPTKKKDGWDIRFKVKNAENNYDISLSVFNNGRAMVVVNSYSRDPITFTGEVNQETK